MKEIESTNDEQNLPEIGRKEKKCSLEKMNGERKMNEKSKR